MENYNLPTKYTLEKLRSFIPSNPISESNYNTLIVDKEFGSGEIRCVSFNEGINVVEFELTLKFDTSFTLDIETSEMIFFMYCLNGKCFHKFKDDATSTQIDELQTAVAFSFEGFLNEIQIKKDTSVIFNLVIIDKTDYLANSKQIIENTGVDLKELLHSFSFKKDTFLLGQINLEIAEYIKLLDKAKFTDDASTMLYFEGICHLIVAKQIEQYRILQELENYTKLNLMTREMDIIVEMTEQFRNEPQEKYALNTLTKTYGMAPNKMQLGFKHIHGCTVGEFIRNERLKKAEILIRTTDMNISEVAYSVGFTSRSYFCKIFKGKFGCIPNKYKQMIAKLPRINKIQDIKTRLAKI